MKFHKFKKLIEANPSQLIFLFPYTKGFRKEDFKHNIHWGRLREFARNHLQFIAYRPKPTDLKGFLDIMGGQSSRCIEERWPARDTAKHFPKAQEITFGLRTVFFFVAAYNVPTHWIALGFTSLPKKDGLGPNAVIDVIKTIQKKNPDSIIDLIVRHTVIHIGSVTEVSLEVYPLATTAADCLKRCDGWFGIKAT